MKDGPVPKLLTTEEVCDLVGICSRTLRSHIQAGLLAYIAVGRSSGRKRRMFHPDDVHAFIAARRVIEAPPTPTRRSRQRPAAPHVIDFKALRRERSRR